MQQARLYQSERRQREQAEALRAIGEALNATLDFDEVLHLILDQLTKVWCRMIPPTSSLLKEIPPPSAITGAMSGMA
ncbi:MAG: hypothetical protein M5U34_25340 [Chloroflexi bacterium]|nr:hypothetical protein [Chloroflexota bacterium]